jgi:hypothetical protein
VIATVSFELSLTDVFLSEYSSSLREEELSRRTPTPTLNLIWQRRPTIAKINDVFLSEHSSSMREEELNRRIPIALRDARR